MDAELPLWFAKSIWIMSCWQKKNYQTHRKCIIHNSTILEQHIPISSPDTLTSLLIFELFNFSFLAIFVLLSIISLWHLWWEVQHQRSFCSHVYFLGSLPAIYGWTPKAWNKIIIQLSMNHYATEFDVLTTPSILMWHAYYPSILIYISSGFWEDNIFLQAIMDFSNAPTTSKRSSKLVLK